MMSLDDENTFTPPAAGGGASGAGGASMSLDGGASPPGYGGPPGFGGQQQQNQAPQQVQETSFFDMAVNAFAAGRDAHGYRYLQAEFVANRERFSEMPLSFWTQKRNPTIGMRFGVGVQYIAQDGVSGKAPVIGDPAPTINRGNTGGSAQGPGISSGYGGPSGIGGPGGGGGGNVPRDARGHLEYYGGDLAKSFIGKMEERLRGTTPAYGEVWPQLNVKVMLPDTGRSSTYVSNQSGGGAGLPVGGPSGAGSGGGPAGGYGGQGNTGAAEGLFPGLMMLGEGTFAELIKLAQKEGLDGVFVLQQQATVARRTGVVSSQTTLKFYTCEDGREKASTSALNYAQVAQQRVGLSDASRDPVERELNNLFNRVDRHLELIPMPALDEDNAVRRLQSISEESKQDPLGFLIEANYYVQQGWLDENRAQELIIEVLGEPMALELWSGDFERQKAALKKWLPLES